MEVVGYTATIIVGISLLVGLLFTIKTVYDNASAVTYLLRKTAGPVKECIDRGILYESGCVSNYGDK